MASDLDSVLSLCVREAASRWNIALSYAELDVIAEHLSEDLDEIGACFDSFNFEREVEEDYAEAYEEDED